MTNKAENINTTKDMSWFSYVVLKCMSWSPVMPAIPCGNSKPAVARTISPAIYDGQEIMDQIKAFKESYPE